MWPSKVKSHNIISVLEFELKVLSQEQEIFCFIRSMYLFTVLGNLLIYWVSVLLSTSVTTCKCSFPACPCLLYALISIIVEMMVCTSKLVGRSLHLLATWPRCFFYHFGMFGWYGSYYVILWPVSHHLSPLAPLHTHEHSAIYILFLVTCDLSSDLSVSQFRCVAVHVH
jgi:hypothetical protein